MWDVYKAKRWMLQVGMDHIKDGLYAEGGELVYESKWGDGCDTEKLFRESLRQICWWDKDMIDDSIKEIHNEANIS
jgi:hypothetical protein